MKRPSDSARNRGPRGRRRPPPSLKDRTVASWRGYWEPEDLEKNLQPVRGVVSGTLEKLGLGQRFAEEEMIQAWTDFVGDFVAEHARPQSVRHGVLYVQVLQSAIHYSLEREKGALLKRLQQRFGTRAIRDIRFRIG